MDHFNGFNNNYFGMMAIELQGDVKTTIAL